MKEFEKWWENVEDMSIVRPQEIWKAALEWVKEKLNCEVQPGDIEYFIDKELNNE